MERLRVGLDVRPLQSGGGSAERGIGRYVTDLVLGLRDHAPEIHPVLFGLAGRPAPPAFEGFEWIPVEGPIFADAPKPWWGKVPKLRSSNALWGRRHRMMREELKAGMTRAVGGANLDLLHFPSAVDVGSYPEVDSDLPQIRTFLDAIPIRLRGTYFDTWPAFMQAYYREQLAGLNDAALVVAISRATADDAGEFASVPESKLRVIYPSVSDAYRNPNPGPPPFDLEPDGYVLFCSVPDPHKQPEVALEAFARAELDSGIRLVFVCPHDRPETFVIRRMAERLGIADRLLVTGRVSEPEMPALFAGALALVSPSKIEGFGLPAAQAMVAGTPVVVSGTSALGEIVGTAGLTAPPSEAGEFATRLRLLADDVTARVVFRDSGRARAELFRPQNQARALRDVYYEAAGRSSTRPPA